MTIDWHRYVVTAVEDQCVLCGEHRVEGIAYCWQCAKLRCPHCANVHDLNGLQPCNPPPLDTK